jgi:hypothetical protein
MIFLSWPSNTLVITSLLLDNPALAYLPLTGLYENALNAPVITRSISANFADEDGLMESNYCS